MLVSLSKSNSLLEAKLVYFSVPQIRLDVIGIYQAYCTFSFVKVKFRLRRLLHCKQ